VGDRNRGVGSQEMVVVLDVLDFLEVFRLLHIVVLFFEELYGVCSRVSAGGKVADREPNKYTFTVGMTLCKAQPVVGQDTLKASKTFQAR